VEVFSQLFHSADNKIFQIERKKREIEEKQLKKHKFRPKKYCKNSQFRQKSRHANYISHKVKREIYIEKERKNQIEAKCTFHPRINAKSRKMIESDPEGIRENKKLEIFNKNQKIREVEIEKQKKYSFHPRICKNSEKIIDLNRKEFYKLNDIVNREKILQQKRIKLKQFYKENELKLEQQEKERKKRRKNGIESLCIEYDDYLKYKLGYFDVRAKKKKIEELQIELQNKVCTFHPKINKEKQFGWVKVKYNVSDYDQRTNLRKNFISYRNKEAIPSFKPKLISKQMNSNFSSKYRDINYLKRKKEHYILQRKFIEDSKIHKNCTFRPDISNSQMKLDDAVGIAPDPVIVPGVQNYLNKCEHAKQLSEVRKQLEVDAFKVKIFDYNSKWKFTIPRPFKFGRSRSQRRKDELADESLKKYLVNLSLQEISNIKYLYS